MLSVLAPSSRFLCKQLLDHLLLAGVHVLPYVTKNHLSVSGVAMQEMIVLKSRTYKSNPHYALTISACF